MKAIIKFLSAVAVMIALCAGFWACNEPQQPEQQEEGTEIQPISVIEVSDEVDRFFTSNLLQMADSIFTNWQTMITTNDCVIINSADELPEIVDHFGNLIEYPAVDFDSNTLVIGHFANSPLLGGVGEMCLVDQRVVVGSDEVILYLYLDYALDFSFFPRLFYGLYPKLPDLPINVVRNN